MQTISRGGHAVYTLRSWQTVCLVYHHDSLIRSVPPAAVFVGPSSYEETPDRVGGFEIVPRCLFLSPARPAGRPPPGGSSVCRHRSLIAALNASQKAPSHSFYICILLCFFLFFFLVWVDRSQNSTKTASSFFKIFLSLLSSPQPPAAAFKASFYCARLVWICRVWRCSRLSAATTAAWLKGIIPRSELGLVVEVHCRGRCGPGWIRDLYSHYNPCVV